MQALNEKYGKFFVFESYVCSAKTGEGITKVF